MIDFIFKIIFLDHKEEKFVDKLLEEERIKYFKLKEIIDEFNNSSEKEENSIIITEEIKEAREERNEEKSEKSFAQEFGKNKSLFITFNNKTYELKTKNFLLMRE